jgi:hypothetical protein
MARAPGRLNRSRLTGRSSRLLAGPRFRFFLNKNAFVAAERCSLGLSG